MEPEEIVAVNNLKSECIDDFFKMLNNLEHGVPVNYKLLKERIIFIDYLESYPEILVSFKDLLSLEVDNINTNIQI